MFTRYMKETGHEDELMSRSSMIRILDTCAAQRRHALTCVDYFIADGTNVRPLLSKGKRLNILRLSMTTIT